MLGCILAIAVTVSQVLWLVDMMGKAAVTPVSSMAAWGALLACMPKLSISKLHSIGLGKHVVRCAASHNTSHLQAVYFRWRATRHGLGAAQVPFS